MATSKVKVDKFALNSAKAKYAECSARFKRMTKHMEGVATGNGSMSDFMEAWKPVHLAYGALIDARNALNAVKTGKDIVVYEDIKDNPSTRMRSDTDERLRNLAKARAAKAANANKPLGKTLKEMQATQYAANTATKYNTWVVYQGDAITGKITADSTVTERSVLLNARKTYGPKVTIKLHKALK